MVQPQNRQGSNRQAERGIYAFVRGSLPPPGSFLGGSLSEKFRRTIPRSNRRDSGLPYHHCRAVGRCAYAAPMKKFSESFVGTLDVSIETDAPTGGDDSRTKIVFATDGGFMFADGETTEVVLDVHGDLEVSQLAEAFLWAGEQLKSLDRK